VGKEEIAAGFGELKGGSLDEARISFLACFPLPMTNPSGDLRAYEAVGKGAPSERIGAGLSVFRFRWE